MCTLSLVVSLHSGIIFISDHSVSINDLKHERIFSTINIQITQDKSFIKILNEIEKFLVYLCTFFNFIKSNISLHINYFLC